MYTSVEAGQETGTNIFKKGDRRLATFSKTGNMCFVMLGFKHLASHFVVLLLTVDVIVLALL